MLCFGLFSKSASTHSFRSSLAMKLSTTPRSSMYTRLFLPEPSNTPGTCFTDGIDTWARAFLRLLCFAEELPALTLLEYLARLRLLCWRLCERPCSLAFERWRWGPRWGRALPPVRSCACGRVAWWLAGALNLSEQNILI